MILREDAPVRSCTEVGRGDYVQTKQGWRKIRRNTAFRRWFIPKTWTVEIEDGSELGVFDCLRYAKPCDLIHS